MHANIIWTLLSDTHGTNLCPRDSHSSILSSHPISLVPTLIVTMNAKVVQR